MSTNTDVTQNLKLFLPEQPGSDGQTSINHDLRVDIIPTNSRHLRRIKVYADSEIIFEFSFVITPPYDIGIFESSHSALTEEIVGQTVALLKKQFGFNESPLLDLVGRKTEHLNLKLFNSSIRVLTSDAPTFN